MTAPHDPLDHQQPADTSEQQPASGAAPDDNDFPLGKACDLTGEGTCEACQ